MAEGKCAACNEPLQLVGDCGPGSLVKMQIFEAMGRQYHAGCFVCAICGKPFEDGRYVWNSKDEQPLHATCSAAANEPKCFKCNKPLDPSHAVVDDKTYHWECFTCTDCGCTLENGYTLTDGNPYCTDHRKAVTVKTGEKTAVGDKYTLDSRTLEKIFIEAESGRKYRLKLGVKYYEDEKQKPKYGGAATWRMA